MKQYEWDLKCISTRSAQKQISENWFRTPKATHRTQTLQSDNKIQSRKTLETKLTTQPCTSFKEEFQKISSKIGSFVTPTSEFQSPMQQIYEHQVQELKTIDMQNENVSLQQENLTLKQQVQIQKDQIKHKDMVIKKLNFTIQQLTSYNQQLKLSLGSDTDLAKQKAQIKMLENELADKTNQIQQFSKIQDEIKSLEDFYVKMLSKMKSDLLFQNRELLKLLNHVQCMSQIAILSLQHEELPIDLLFKYKQYGLFEEEQQINQKVEVFELTKENGNLLSKILDDIKKTFEKISYHLVEGFSLLTKH
ncbi:unnamed protein product (macronuclear) [Paramecium tetraurelia]|uniref:Uncharacterized protein n=1 Tax=Paramecium tetraurelia TaxID=5888 RepID=A0EAG6_PARTE|nr:uncharacterized protein GSPATT00025015001 [Paramecium tetraurelia]CAK92283.1 unnamed protein product [Paramecium tetraurelia]|eukprot:XP_001459680.1 hypothetical protein (macronuclear) [Paramecium tetraurelia strain d4-2]